MKNKFTFITRAISSMFLVMIVLSACDKNEDPPQVAVSSALGVNGKDIILTWTAPANNPAEASYKVSNGDSILAELSVLTYTVTGLEYNTEYTFYIVAIDAAGEQSAGTKITVTTASYGNGAFIINEGGYGKNNGSISFYEYKSDKITNNIFTSVNGRQVGDVVQSLKLHNEKAFIVVNNSSKVEVANRYTFKEIGVIEGVKSPRYFETSGTKGYLTCWGDNSVKVIDLATLSISKSISVGAGPERMLIADNKLYVANSGGYGTDSTITVIDITTDEVVTNIAVNYNPKALVLNKNGNIFALSHGKAIYNSEAPYNLIEESASMIYKIDVLTNLVVGSVKLFEKEHPSILTIDTDSDVLYFGGGYGFSGIYMIDISGNQLDKVKFIEGSSYGFSFNTIRDELYVLDAPSFTEQGKFKRYDSNATLSGTYDVGIGPNGTAF